MTFTRGQTLIGAAATTAAAALPAVAMEVPAKTYTGSWLVGSGTRIFVYASSPREIATASGWLRYPARHNVDVTFMSITITRRQTIIGAAATVAAGCCLPAIATATVESEHLSFLVDCLRNGVAPYGTRWTGMLVHRGRRCMIFASASTPNVADLCWFDVSEESGIATDGFTPDDIISRAGMRKTERWCMGGRA